MEPWQSMWKGVFEGTGESIREAHCVTDEAAARGHEWCAGAHGGTLGLQGLELITMFEQELKLECGVSRVVRGLAGGEGRAIARQREWLAGTEPEASGLTQGRDARPLIECKAKGKRWPFEPRAPGAPPRIDRVWLVVKGPARALLRAGRLQADIVLGRGPVEADEGGTLLRRWRRHVSPPVKDARVGEGTGRLACCEGIRGSRERGSPCVGVDERPRPRGGAGMVESLRGFGRDTRTRRGHGRLALTDPCQV